MSHVLVETLDNLEGLGDIPVTTFKITYGGTVRGKDILVDSNGYTYTMKWKKDPTSEFSSWVCSLRSKTRRCPVSSMVIVSDLGGIKNMSIHHLLEEMLLLPSRLQ